MQESIREYQICDVEPYINKKRFGCRRKLGKC